MQVKKKESRGKSRHNYCSVRANSRQSPRQVQRRFARKRKESTNMSNSGSDVSRALSRTNICPISFFLSICKSDSQSLYTDPLRPRLPLRVHNTISKNHLPQCIQFDSTGVLPILLNNEKSNVQPPN